VDEASALRLAQKSKPDELESLEPEIMTLQIELESLKNTFLVEQELKENREEAAVLTGVWQTGKWTEIRTNSRLTRVLCRRARLDKVKDVKRRIEEAKHQSDVANNGANSSSPRAYGSLPFPSFNASFPRRGTRRTGIRSRRWRCSVIG
jgi:ATP-dependent Clp protease ATP-binding subunit ClpB